MVVFVLGVGVQGGRGRLFLQVCKDLGFLRRLQAALRETGVAKGSLVLQLLPHSRRSVRLLGGWGMQ